MERPEAAVLGGEKRQVVIMFSDIRGFTPIAETLSPEATIDLVNGYFLQDGGGAAAASRHYRGFPGGCNSGLF